MRTKSRDYSDSIYCFLRVSRLAFSLDLLATMSDKSGAGCFSLSSSGRVGSHVGLIRDSPGVQMSLLLMIATIKNSGKTGKRTGLPMSERWTPDTSGVCSRNAEHLLWRRRVLVQTLDPRCDVY